MSLSRSLPICRALFTGLSPHQGQPVVFDEALKFAFDVFEVIGELSNSQLRLAHAVRPVFHPGCPELMTEEMKRLFGIQWRIAEELNLIYFIMNVQQIQGSGDFLVLLTLVLKSYKRKEFSRELFVEFAFLLGFWTLVLRQRNEWVGATDFALEMITIYTRFIIVRGGFDRCKEWPTAFEARKVDLEIPYNDIYYDDKKKDTL